MIRQDSKLSLLDSSLLPLFFLFLTPLTFSACASHDPPEPPQVLNEETKETEEVGDDSARDAETSSDSRLDRQTQAEPTIPQNNAFSVLKFENLKKYNYCSVFDGVNLFTDEVTHCLVCMESTIFNHEKTRVVFHFKRNGEILSFYKGQPPPPSIYMDPIIRIQKIDVAEMLWSVFADIEAAPSYLDTSLGPGSWGRSVTIRVDQGEAREGTWAKSVNDVIFTPAKALVRNLQDEMAIGKQVMIKVGKDRGNTLPLNGFADAVADYKIRVTQSKELWTQ